MIGESCTNIALFGINCSVERLFFLSRQYLCAGRGHFWGALSERVAFQNGWLGKRSFPKWSLSFREGGAGGGKSLNLKRPMAWPAMIIFGRVSSAWKNASAAVYGGVVVDENRKFIDDRSTEWIGFIVATFNKTNAVNIWKKDLLNLRKDLFVSTPAMVRLPKNVAKICFWSF